MAKFVPEHWCKAPGRCSSDGVCNDAWHCAAASALVPEQPDRKLVPLINRGHPVHRDPAEWPAPLGDVVRAVLDPHPDIPLPASFPDHMVQNALAWLASHADALQPPDHGMLVQWLLPICGAVRNPPTEDDFKRRVGALELGSASLPAFCFTAHTQALGLSTWVFMPAVADIVALVSEAHAPALERLRAVRRIAGQ